MGLWVLLFLGGSVGGFLCDQIHVRSHVLAYPHPWLLGEAWWVAPQFGAATVLALASAMVLARATKSPAGQRGTGQVWGDLAWFLGAYLASGLVHRWPVALAVALVATWLARMAWRPDRYPIVAFSLLFAAIGTLYEITLTRHGLFAYAHPDFFTVAIWLPGIYLHAGPLAVSGGRLIRGSSIA